MEKSKLDSEKSLAIYDLNIGFIAGITVLFGDFCGNIFYEEFNFKYYYYIKILLPLLIFFIIRIYIKTRKE